MNPIELMQMGFAGIFSDPIIFVLLIGGIFLGMVFGAIPGLTSALAVTLTLPFTYAMTAGQGLSLLIALYVGGISGGLISSILLNIPGTPSSLVTCFDGTPMARNGRAADALTLGVFASLVGGILSAVALIFVAPYVAKIALAFGEWEFFAMGVMGLCVVVSLTGNDIVKGLVSAVIGSIIAMVGIDSVSNAERFTFGFWQLGAGLSILATLMGLFALAEILTQLRNLSQVTTIRQVGRVTMIHRKGLIKKDFFKTFMSGSLIGIGVGILPGIGQSTSTLLAYSYAKQTSKTPEKFGTGYEEGLIASETSNNATCGGALIPMLTLGIPGDTVTAILLGGLVVHGLTPGPMLFTRNAQLVGIVFVSYLLCNIIMYIMEMGLMKVFIKLLKIPLNYLFPIILLMCVVGTFTINNRVFDCWVLFIIGIVGYMLRNGGYPIAPIVLGYVLGPIVELHLRTALLQTQGDFAPLFSRPIALGLLAFGVFMVILPGITKKRRAKKMAAAGLPADIEE